MHTAQPKNQQQQQSKHWTFTLNNYTDEEFNALVDIDADYKILGREVGESGTKYIQGYIVFSKRLRFSQAKQHIGSRAHIEQTKGTPEQNRAYCMKDGDYVEIGTLPLTGSKATKRKWHEIWEHAKNGNIEKIDPDILIRHYGNIKKIRLDHQQYNIEELGTLSHEWIFGPTGTGKSRAARDENPNYYAKSCNKWWDGYDNQPVVIIDDLDKSHFVLGHHIKIWADHYAFPAEVKGGAIKIRPQKIIITSNYHPSEIWQEENILNPILRRFNVIHKTQ